MSFFFLPSCHSSFGLVGIYGAEYYEMILALRNLKFGVTWTVMWTKGCREVNSGFKQVLWGKPGPLCGQCQSG